ncbi:hypothetical protein BV25DRAFT_1838598 [Artomyces pyxidatus]|uniref:Uncharacterized protein n=1 Tax=Artomyces pyxidatus TaxID=48021 RepID=A0ACB8T1R2_9AGAM|nr:hypothetical protein BV25DRAFT_1838598 [Artomyces pyxidatus]
MSLGQYPTALRRQYQFASSSYSHTAHCRSPRPQVLLLRATRCMGNVPSLRLPLPFEDSRTPTYVASTPRELDWCCLKECDETTVYNSFFMPSKLPIEPTAPRLSTKCTPQYSPPSPGPHKTYGQRAPRETVLLIEVARWKDSGAYQYWLLYLVPHALEASSRARHTSSIDQAYPVILIPPSPRKTWGQRAPRATVLLIDVARRKDNGNKVDKLNGFIMTGRHSIQLASAPLYRLFSDAVSTVLSNIVLHRRFRAGLTPSTLTKPTWNNTSPGIQEVFDIAYSPRNYRISPRRLSRVQSWSGRTQLKPNQIPRLGPAYRRPYSRPYHATDAFKVTIPSTTMVLSKDCSIRAYGIRQDGTNHCTSIPTTHQNVDSGLSFPRIEGWFKNDVHVFTAKYNVTNAASRIFYFTIYFTHDHRRYRPSQSVRSNLPGTVWHGEFLVFRRSAHSKKLINVRAKDHLVIWHVIRQCEQVLAPTSRVDVHPKYHRVIADESHTMHG